MLGLSDVANMTDVLRKSLVKKSFPYIILFQSTEAIYYSVSSHLPHLLFRCDNDNTF